MSQHTKGHYVVCSVNITMGFVTAKISNIARTNRDFNEDLPEEEAVRARRLRVRRKSPGRVLVTN